MTESFASSSTQAGQAARPPSVPPLDVAIRTLGCKVNQVESEDIAVDLLGRGCRMTPEEEAAVVIINTCTVTAEADRKARKAVRHALRLPLGPAVVVTGCLAALQRTALESLGERVIVEADKAVVAARVAGVLGATATAPDGEIVALTREGEQFHTRAMVRVQDGCDTFCSYCIVPYARGNPRSVRLNEVAKTTRRLVEAGTQEVVLTGINLGRYADGAAGLADLVQAVALQGPANLRLSSIEPRFLTEELLAVLAETESFCPHLHVPLQSGSDAVLSTMRRGYTLGEYKAIVDRARAVLGPIAVTTDVMVGFPGEGDADFERTVEACEEIGFAKIHVFRYSERDGTPAQAYDGAVDRRVRSQRAATLREVARALREAYADARVGSNAQLLVEETEDGAVPVASGTTRDYLKATCGDCVASIGEIVQVRLFGRDGETMLAEPL